MAKNNAKIRQTKKPTENNKIKEEAKKTSAAPSAADGENGKEKKNIFALGKIFWIAIAILAILLVLSLVVLSFRLFDYAKADDYAVSLKSNMDSKLDVFSVEYSNASGEVTVSGADGEKVIAPGTDVEYTVRLRNTDKVAIDYDLVPEVKIISEYELPIVIRLLDYNDNYLVGDAKTWVPLDALNGISQSATLEKGESAEYIFQWKWPFESGDDAYDSFLGNNSINENISVSIAFSVHAEANTALEYNGGFWGSGSGYTVFGVIFLILLLVAIVLLIISIFKQRIPKEVIVEVPVIKTVEIPVPTPVPTPKSTHTPRIRVPKISGKMAYINIDVLNKHFRSGEKVTLAQLKAKGLISADTKQYKVLAKNGAHLDKALIVEAQSVSHTAREYIIKTGGKVIITEAKAGE
ncbi:MAG: uL15 family ribosomal protein [Clostridia bacterium]|nr:uL15 family ribosomal protein [Clostridia bacterium]